MLGSRAGRAGQLASAADSAMPGRPLSVSVTDVTPCVYVSRVEPGTGDVTSLHATFWVMKALDACVSVLATRCPSTLTSLVREVTSIASHVAVVDTATATVREYATSQPPVTDTT